MENDDHVDLISVAGGFRKMRTVPLNYDIRHQGPVRLLADDCRRDFSIEDDWESCDEQSSG